MQPGEAAEITVERAKASEVNEVRQVLTETWTATYGAFLDDETMETVRRTWHAPDNLRAEMARTQVYFGVARDESGAVVGLVTAHWREPTLLYVSRLYVLPAFQRQGIGGKLLKAAIAIFPRVREVRLDVESQNEIGRAFYKKIGFQEIGRHQDKVGRSTLDVIELSRPLQDEA